MTSFPFPEILDCSSGEKYRLRSNLAASVFYASNTTYADDGTDTRQVAIKLESRNVKYRRLDDRFNAYNSLIGGPGIPFVHSSGTTDSCRYVVLDLLGPCLEDFFQYCDRKFIMKTILLIADQALSRIEYMHAHSCAHRDIQPKNLLMGTGMFSNLLYLVNIGSAKSPDTCQDTGDLFRKDLESLGLVLVHFLWPEFSWEELRSKQMVDESSPAERAQLVVNAWTSLRVADLIEEEYSRSEETSHESWVCHRQVITHYLKELVNARALARGMQSQLEDIIVFEDNSSIRESVVDLIGLASLNI